MARGKMIKMKMSDGAEIGVYRVEPKGARRGGLVLIQEIFGVTEHIKSCCDGYADDGYEVLAPRFIDREAPGFAGELCSPEDIQKAIKMAREPSIPSIFPSKDTQTCIDALKQRPGVHHRLLLWRIGDLGGGLPLHRAGGGDRLLRQPDPGDDRLKAEMPDHLAFRREGSRHSDGRRGEGDSARIPT